MTTKAKLKLKFTKCNQITAFTFLTLQTSNTTVVSSTSTEEINITTRVNHFMKCKNIIPFNTNINTDLCWRWRGEVAGGCWAGRGPLTTLAFSSSTHRGPHSPAPAPMILTRSFTPATVGHTCPPSLHPTPSPSTIYTIINNV